MRANNLTSFKGDKYAIDKDYTAWEVYANDTVIQVGESEALGGYVSVAIPIQMTEGFIIRSDKPYSISDVVIQWGDGVFSYLRKGEYTKLIDEQVEYSYYMQHTYENSGKYIIKIWGKDYFALSHYLTLFDKSLNNNKNLVCRVLDNDLPIASHLVNLSNLFPMSKRLLKVTCPYRSLINQVSNLSWLFKGCSNLLSVKGFDRPYQTCRSILRMFADCTNMVTCDMVLPMYMTHDRGYERAFENCSSWIRDVGTLFPALGFLNQTVIFNRTFYGCANLTGTVPGELLWERVDKDWLNTSEAFAGCTNLIAQVPISWGGSSEEIVVPTRTSKEQTLQSIHNLSVLRASKMPIASENNLNEVYYYTGISNQKYLQGKPYICKLVNGEYVWVELTPSFPEMGSVTNPIAWTHYGKIELMWTDPDRYIMDDDIIVTEWAKTVIVMKENSYPSTITDGVVYEITDWNANTDNPLILSNSFADSENDIFIRWFTVSDKDVVNEQPVVRQLDDLSWSELKNILENSNSNCRINLQDHYALGDVIVVENDVTKHSGYDGYAWQIVDIKPNNMTLMAKKCYQTIKFDVPQKNKGIVDPETYQEDYCLKSSNGLTFYLIKDVPVNNVTDNFDYSDTRTWKAENNSYYYELVHCYIYDQEKWMYRTIQHGTVSEWYEANFTLTNYTPYYISSDDVEYYMNVTSNSITSNSNTYYRINDVQMTSNAATQTVGFEYGELTVGFEDGNPDDTWSPYFTIPSNTKIYKIEVTAQYIKNLRIYGRNGNNQSMELTRLPDMGQSNGQMMNYVLNVSYSGTYDQYYIECNIQSQIQGDITIHYGLDNGNNQVNVIYND